MGELALDAAVYIGIPCAIFYAYLRHWVFAVLALSPPLSVLAVAALIGPDGLGSAIAASLFGTICALLLGDLIARGICAGRSRSEIAFDASQLVLFAVGTLFAAYLLSLWADGFILAREGASIYTMLFGAGFSSALVGAWLCSLFPFSEQFIARANSTREWRERTLEHFLPVMHPRWAFSVSGIAIIIGAIAAFGIRDANVRWIAPVAICFPIGAFFALAGFAIVTQQWRMTAAPTLATLFSGTLLVWSYLRLTSFPDPLTVSSMLMISSAPLSVMVVRTLDCVREGDDVAVSLSIAVCEYGAVVIVLGFLAMLRGIHLFALYGMYSGAFAFAIASIFATLLLFPALTIAIYTILPRYRTVDEVFGKR